MKEIAKFLKLMILTSISGGFAFIGYTFYAGYEDGRIFAAEPPPPPPTAHELALAAFDAQLWAVTKWALLLLLLLACGLALLRFLYVPIKRSNLIYPDERGNWPLLKMPTYKDHNGTIHHTWHNENLSAAPGTTYAYNGTVNYTGHQDAATPDQYRFASMGWGHQIAQAVASTGKITAGAVNAIAGRSPERIERERLQTERERLRLQLVQDRLNRGTPVVQDAPLLPPPPPLSFDEAIAQSTPTHWILGQGAEQQPANPHAVGQPLVYDPRSSHIALIGATRTGKTSNTGLMVVMLARRHGLHPIVFDGKGGLDWGPLDGVVEWHDMNDGNLGAYIDGLVQVYEKRYQKLIQLGKGHIYQLPAERRPVPVFAMFEEFGEHFTSLAKAERLAVGKQMNTLFRLGQAAGITLCLIDQAPEKWTQQMRGNSKFVVCYKLKGGAANAFNEYHADQLPDRGVFSQDNTFYKAWHTEVEAPDLARMFSPISRRLLPVIDGERANASPPPTNERRTVANVPVQVVRTNERPENEGGDTGEIITIPPSLERSFVRSGNWAEFCEGLYQLYPLMTQAQLRRAMAQVDGKKPDQYKGVGFEMYHRFSPNGDRSKFS